MTLQRLIESYWGAHQYSGKNTEAQLCLTKYNTEVMKVKQNNCNMQIWALRP